MERSDIEKLVQLRQHVIQQYDWLDGKDTNLAVTPTREVALAYESIIRSIEDILSSHITVEKKT